jgi:signal transduction histidine kinase/CheY-like chemotaxis protein
LHEEPEIIARIRRGERVEHFETVRLRKDGGSIEVSLTISPIRNPCGEITGASHIARDITSRKQLDEHLRQTQKLESLGVLAGGIAHDFNNLLVGILGNASLAQDMVSEESRIRPILEGVVTASERAAQLTNQMLAYSGKGRFVIERKQIRDLVRETLPLIQASIPRTVQLELELEDAVAPVEVDVAQMQQLIMNLVINGAEAVPAGRPGAVTISASEVQVDEKYLRAARASNQIASGAYVCIAVRDTGAGMDEGTKARMFDPFFTTKFTGRGLGLAAVLGIVRGHKGFSIVDSTPGQGTTFRVFLPAAASSHVVSDTKRSTGGLAGSATVLVVDDEAIVRQLTTQVLQGHGHTVLVAENGEKGIEVFSEHASEINLVLLDLTMPVMSGEETFVAMKKLHPNVPIILSSGYSQLEATRRFEGKDVAGFLQKPYRSTTLVETVNEVIGHSKGGLAAG